MYKIINLHIFQNILHPLNKIIQLVVTKSYTWVLLSSFTTISSTSFIFLLSSYFAGVGPLLDFILEQCYCPPTGLQTFDIFYLHFLELLKDSQVILMKR